MLLFHAFNRICVDPGDNLLRVNSVPTGREDAETVGLEVVGNTRDDYGVFADFIREEFCRSFICVVQADTHCRVGEYSLKFGADACLVGAFDLADVLQDNRQAAVGTTDDS